MSELTQTSPAWRMKPWPTILLSGVLAFGIYSLGAFWVQPDSGSCMFVLPGFFYVLVTVLPILLLRRFGVGVGVFLINGVVGGGHRNAHITYFNTSKAFFSLPWLIISGGFGGYNAYAMVKKV